MRLKGGCGESVSVFKYPQNQEILQDFVAVFVNLMRSYDRIFLTF